MPYLTFTQRKPPPFFLFCAPLIPLPLRKLLHVCDPITSHTPHQGEEGKEVSLSVQRRNTSCRETKRHRHLVTAKNNVTHHTPLFSKAPSICHILKKGRAETAYRVDGDPPPHRRHSRLPMGAGLVVRSWAAKGIRCLTRVRVATVFGSNFPVKPASIRSALRWLFSARFETER